MKVTKFIVKNNQLDIDNLMNNILSYYNEDITLLSNKMFTIDTPDECEIDFMYFVTETEDEKNEIIYLLASGGILLSVEDVTDEVKMNAFELDGIGNDLENMIKMTFLLIDKLTPDDILDKINKYGVDSLLETDKQTLKNI